MKRFIAGLAVGLLLGIGVSVAVFIPVILSERESNHGRLVGYAEAADSLAGEFGLYNGQGAYKRLFSVKTTDVISIETNGVRTVRVIP
jgi:hypothetical protein